MESFLKEAGESVAVVPQQMLAWFSEEGIEEI